MSTKCLKRLDLKTIQKCFIFSATLRPITQTRNQLIVRQKNSFNTHLIKCNQRLNFSNECKTTKFCWKCNESIESEVLLFCPKCQSIQALNSSLNYFDLFEQKVSFDIKLINLNKRFKSLQMSTHPDRYVTTSERLFSTFLAHFVDRHSNNLPFNAIHMPYHSLNAYTVFCVKLFANIPLKPPTPPTQREHRYSQDNSSLINMAYKTLRDPYERGLYLLNLSNTSIEESDNQIGSEFLMEIMKTNEEIEENDKSFDKLSNIFKVNENNIKGLNSQLLDAFSTDDISKAKHLLRKIKFYITINQSLKEKLQNLG